MEIVLLKESYDKCYQAKIDAYQIGELTLAYKNPFRLYSIFLNEQLLIWKLLRISYNLSHDPDDKEFVKSFTESTSAQQNLLCEFFIHNFFLERHVDFFLNFFVSEVQLREFISTMQNQIQWKDRKR